MNATYSAEAATVIKVIRSKISITISRAVCSGALFPSETAMSCCHVERRLATVMCLRGPLLQCRVRRSRAAVAAVTASMPRLAIKAQCSIAFKLAVTCGRGG